MSAIDLASYVQRRMKTLNISMKDAATRSGLSRQTWHKLMRAEIQEAKVSTLIKVAAILRISVPVLLDIYFQSRTSATPVQIIPVVREFESTL
ncbi:Helix-turn-helix domain-containing protein [Thiothrix caldifontis]|uniref:Helix-turn-helix domain-containing protein n=1 Tax=Thiothrix caldifontis TaxID=525918 RepID=A0A1H3ZB53_9GAMM|nr:Helix-turn-helix domain-containing protein [Thiothrix caldifontis]